MDSRRLLIRHGPYTSLNRETDCKVFLVLDGWRFCRHLGTFELLKNIRPQAMKLTITIENCRRTYRACQTLDPESGTHTCYPFFPFSETSTTVVVEKFPYQIFITQHENAATTVTWHRTYNNAG